MSDGKPEDLAARVDRLAAEAAEAGKKFLETDTGKKVAELTDSAFATAGEMGKKLADSELGQKALNSDLGKQATEMARNADDQAKAKITNPLARNMAIGAAAGAVVAIPIPIIGPIIGALIGGGLGYLRTLTKKP